jgi:hypothetical protein
VPASNRPEVRSHHTQHTHTRISRAIWRATQQASKAPPAKVVCPLGNLRSFRARRDPVSADLKMCVKFLFDLFLSLCGSLSSTFSLSLRSCRHRAHRFLAGRPVCFSHTSRAFLPNLAAGCHARARLAAAHSRPASGTRLRSPCGVRSADCTCTCAKVIEDEKHSSVLAFFRDVLGLVRLTTNRHTHQLAIAGSRLSPASTAPQAPMPGRGWRRSCYPRCRPTSWC